MKTFLNKLVVKYFLFIFSTMILPATVITFVLFDIWRLFRENGGDWVITVLFLCILALIVLIIVWIYRHSTPFKLLPKIKIATGVGIGLYLGFNADGWIICLPFVLIEFNIVKKNHL